MTDCTTCGSPLEAGARFCNRCGVAVVPAVLAPTMEQPRVTSPLDAQPIAAVQPMPAPVYEMPVTIPNANTAVISLVCGILAWTVFPVICSIAAVVTGHMARNEIRSSGGRLAGGGMATAGLVLGYIQLAFLILGLLAVCVFVVFFGGLAALSGA